LRHELTEIDHGGRQMNARQKLVMAAITILSATLLRVTFPWFPTRKRSPI
jgi:hypothetical protein